jgi:hypothetical protein
VPFPDYVGLDSFSYTLLSQHGQAGMTKGIYVEVTALPVPPPPPPPPPSLTVVPRKARVDETEDYFEWIVTKTSSANVDVRFSTNGTVTPNQDFWDQIFYADLLSASMAIFTPVVGRQPVTLSESVYIVRVGPIINDPFGEPMETIILKVVDTGTGSELATSIINIVDG